MRIEGLAASANSFGSKIGSGLGAATVMWAISLCGYDSNATVQSAAAINTVKALYWWIPAVLSAILLFLASRWKIESDTETKADEN